MALKDNNSSEPLLSRSERVEADGIVSIPAGPSANLISVEADPCGGIYYRIESNPPRVFQIGDEFANRNLAIIDTVRAVWILESESNRLLAVCAPPAGAPRIYLFGDLWKSFVSEQGQRSRCNDPIVLMKGAKVPALLDPKTNQLSFEVNINIHFREAFSKDAISTFQPNSSDHLINLCFDLPSGNFRRGQVFIHDRKSHGS
ncbi:hypothetical protein HYR69_06795, partial [Candidatus Sumerlaeota bacterium]|nr:hypothetical protein [Candidatus Sumerlaeota bacterium]